MSFDLKDYIDVPTRIAEFRDKHPEGSLRPLDPTQPFTVATVGDKTFVVYAAAAFRTPDDPCPGVGLAWEPFPGHTPYTRDSELMNAETSAWGRAIVAALAADTRKGIASAEEVQARQGDAIQSGSHTGGSPFRGGNGGRVATDKQRALIERMVNETGLVPEVWPLADDLSMRDASALIEKLKAEPKPAKAERRSTMRVEDVATALDGSEVF